MAEHNIPNDNLPPFSDADVEERDELDEGWNPHPLPPLSADEFARQLRAAEARDQARQQLERALAEEQEPE